MRQIPQEAIMAVRSIPFSVTWTWSAVFAGVLTSLMLQLLFGILGLGIGLLAVDLPTANSAPAAVGWPAFAWWAVSGVVSAFVGGAVAAALSPDDTLIGRVGHSLAAWALATLIVVGASVAGAGTVGNVATNMAGPVYSANQRWDYFANRNQTRTTTGQTAPTPTRAQLEEARKHFAYVMLASFLALVCGAGAAYGAGATMDPRTTRKVSEAVS
jgi:hypothetical protein